MPTWNNEGNEGSMTVAILGYAVYGITTSAHIFILPSTPRFSGLSCLSGSSDLVYKSLERFRMTSTDFAPKAQ